MSLADNFEKKDAYRLKWRLDNIQLCQTLFNFQRNRNNTFSPLRSLHSILLTLYVPILVFSDVNVFV
jgi:hypothetical protein